MAKQTGILPFTGKLGSVIGYCVDGQYLLRSVAGQVRQSPRTKLAAAHFGKDTHAKRAAPHGRPFSYLHTLYNQMW
ncbi:hypothetical protein ACWKWU_19060 [Chitinophaga lutea]